MNPAILLYALQLLQALPGLIAAGYDVLNLIKKSNAAIALMVAENRKPTDAEWDELNAVTDSLRDRLHTD